MCFGITSYNGQVNFGLIGDYDAMSDLEALARDLETSLAELAATVPEVDEPAQEPSADGRQATKA